MKSRQSLRLRIVNGHNYGTYSAINVNIHFTCFVNGLNEIDRVGNTDENKYV